MNQEWTMEIHERPIGPSFSRQVIVLNATSSFKPQVVTVIWIWSKAHRLRVRGTQLNTRTRTAGMVPGPTATATFRPNPRLLNLLSDYEWLPAAVVTCTSLTRSSLVRLRSYTKRLVLRYSAFLPNIIPQEHRVATSKLNIRGIEPDVQAYHDNTEYWMSNIEQERRR